VILAAHKLVHNISLHTDKELVRELELWIPLLEFFKWFLEASVSARPNH
jgi:hypothetical protein